MEPDQELVRQCFLREQVSFQSGGHGEGVASRHSSAKRRAAASWDTQPLGRRGGFRCGLSRGMKRDAGPAALVCHPREGGWSFVVVHLPVPPRAMWLAGWASATPDKGGRVAGLGMWGCPANPTLGRRRGLDGPPVLRADTSPLLSARECLSHVVHGGRKVPGIPVWSRSYENWNTNTRLPGSKQKARSDRV